MATQQRIFALGERVRVAKKSRVVDKQRAQEGLPKDKKYRPPIDVDVTGISGEVCAPAYESPSRGGEIMVPIRLPNEAVIAVPEDRVERDAPPPPREILKAEERAAFGEEKMGSSVSRETLEFWKKYFSNDGR